MTPLNYSVDLLLVEEGLVPANAEDIFDPFSEAFLIFHDVFEHWFEGQHKYFKGDSAFQTFGEMVALSASCVFSSMGFNRNEGRRHSSESVKSYHCIRDYQSFVYDTKEGYERYESSNCSIPYQKPLDSTYLTQESIELEREILYQEESGNKAPSKAFLKNMIRSVRYGARMAIKLVGDNKNATYNTFDAFLTIVKRWIEQGLLVDMQPYCEYLSTYAYNKKFRGIPVEEREDYFSLERIKFHVRSSKSKGVRVSAELFTTEGDSFLIPIKRR